MRLPSGLEGPILRLSWLLKAVLAGISGGYDRASASRPLGQKEAAQGRHSEPIEHGVINIVQASAGPKRLRESSLVYPTRLSRQPIEQAI